MENIGLFVGLLAGVLICFFFSVFSTFAEKAFDTASQTKLRYLSGSWSGKQAIKLSAKKEATLETVRVLDVLSQIGLSTCLVILCLDYLPIYWLAILIAVLVSVLANVLFGELLASVWGSRKPEVYAKASAPLVTVFFVLLYPLTMFLGFFKATVSKLLKIKPKPELSERDLKAVVTDVYDEGAIEKDEHDLIQNSLNFDDKTIDRIMTPLKSVVMATTDMDAKAIEKLFIENNYSRMPYLDVHTHQVIGFLYQKDFYEMLLDGKSDVSSQVKPALFFQSNTNASLALRRLQRFRQHMAIVRDSSNAVIGLITVEDLVEEIVGEIEDESDAEDLEKARTMAMKSQAKEAIAEDQKMRADLNDTIILPRVELEAEEAKEEKEAAKEKKGGRR